ncbi:endonuclease exonuclease phosphatase [Leptolyngbya sp. Heron Island J]|uniref:pre-peptidase C-terminal domain-containing protein n=1 Tax=Leptolyngbya sp. Heron Island J TaxID=1385935 RepID=UPI0003B9B0CE|nr:pre-peptidase C-terminal domain-containing protein [Leptolyngbya sp. Heron Island J]ESA35254.1 endonuclease exonuclease phosphatase [Leptolyngbya sp. Heron Island J]
MVCSLIQRVSPVWLLAVISVWVAISPPTAAQTTLRIMAANTTSGNFQSYDPGEGTRIFQGLTPDIVLIQEFNIGDNSENDIEAWIDTTFGEEFVYYREYDAQIPNGIISRYPILESGEWDDPAVSNRDFAWAKLDLPGEQDLWAISVHFLTRSDNTRNIQANALVEFVQAHVPDQDLLVIGGDLNTRNITESALQTLGNVVNTRPPYPIDQDGDIDTNASRSRPYDWVFADIDLQEYEVPVEIGENTFSHGLVFDSRVYSPLSDVEPIRRNDSDASNMQHMAVIKDFFIPKQRLGSSPLRSCRTITENVSNGGWRQYYFDIPSGTTQVEIQLMAANEDHRSDVDLYVRQQAEPSLSSYDFRPWLNGSNETVILNDPTRPELSSGRWYIGTYGYLGGEYSLTALVDNCEA